MVEDLPCVHKRSCNAGNRLHFSVDDTIGIFQDLTWNENKYESIFDNDILKFFKKCHERYGLKVSLYCYYENEDFNLSMVPNVYIEEFTSNADWLQFGFHYRNGLEPQELSAQEIAQDYQKFTNELVRKIGRAHV